MFAWALAFFYWNNFLRDTKDRTPPLSWTVDCHNQSNFHSIDPFIVTTRVGTLYIMSPKDDANVPSEGAVAAVLDTTGEELREPLLSPPSELPVTGDDNAATTTHDQEAEEVQQQQEQDSSSIDVWDRMWWRFTHALGFASGGLLFTIGTLLYYLAIQDAGDAKEVAFLGDETAWMYVIGSFGFLYVDVLEFFTFVDEPWLRTNIACSMVGSTFYVIGSAGFLPKPYAWNPLVGILGFIAGSLMIGCSQAWKLCRILRSSTTTGAGNGIDEEQQQQEVEEPTTSRNARSDAINAACVEGGACVGGFAFLIGTIVYWAGPVEGDPHCVKSCTNYQVVLALWTLGSLTFLFGGLSLSYRHAVMKIT